MTVRCLLNGFFSFWVNVVHKESNFLKSTIYVINFQQLFNFASRSYYLKYNCSIASFPIYFGRILHDDVAIFSRRKGVVVGW